MQLPRKRPIPKSGKTTSVLERISPHSFRNSENFPWLGVNGVICEVGFEPFWTIPNLLFINWPRNQVPDQWQECHFEQMTSSEQHWITAPASWKWMEIKQDVIPSNKIPQISVTVDIHSSSAETSVESNNQKTTAWKKIIDPLLNEN